MSMHRIDTKLTALLLALSLASLAEAGSTRASGMFNYPEPERGSNGFGNLNQNYSSFGRLNSNRIRIALTRNISYQDSDRLVAPEVSYYGAVGFGTPPNVLNVVFDTGSHEIWIPYYNWLPFANNLHYRDGFKCSSSRTCDPLKRQVEINYRGTKLNGETYEDTVTAYEDMVRDDAHHAITSHIGFRQNFIAVEDASDEQFRYKPYDGVIGLPAVQQSASGVQNFLLSFLGGAYSGQEDAASQSQEPYNSNQPQPHSMGYPNANNGPDGYYAGNSHQANVVFAFWFNPNQNSRHGGELTIGGVDERRFSGEIFFHRIIGWYDWRLPVDFVMLGGEVVSCSNGCNAVLDTGANSLVGPRQDVEAIYGLLNAQYDRDSDLWLVQCNTVEQLPTMTIRIEGLPYLIYPTHYVKRFRYKDSVACYMGVKPWDQQNWLLGTNFIGAYYTVFDFASRKVGFATARGSVYP